MSTIVLKKANNHIVKAIPIEKDKRPVKGGDLVDELYCNIFEVASTNSGKTTVTFYLLQHLIGTHTTVICFVSTFYNDPNWLAIKDWCEKKNINLIVHSSIKEDGVNYVDEILSELKKEAEERDKEKESKKPNAQPDLEQILINLKFGEGYVQDNKTQEQKDEEEEKKHPKRREKRRTPDYLMIFDDLSEELRFKEYAKLLKKSRHYHIKTITSSQYIMDMAKSARKQIRIWLLFAGFSEEQLEDIYKTLQIKISFQALLKMYQTAVVPDDLHPKPFLYINCVTNDYRKCFDKVFELPEEILNPGAVKLKSKE